MSNLTTVATDKKLYRSIKPSDLATVDRQKIIGVFTPAKKTRVYESTIGGSKLTPGGGTLPHFATDGYISKTQIHNAWIYQVPRFTRSELFTLKTSHMCKLM